MTEESFRALQKSVRECNICESVLPLGPRPVFQISRTAKLLIAGQAPGHKVHTSGIPFDDASGDRLREWLGIDRSIFYDSARVAILPMGFCYPGTGSSGDLPPRHECVATWRAKILQELTSVTHTLVIGQYAMAWHLGKRNKSTLTETVRAWREFHPYLWPLPHPSPRNNIWLKKNPWFAAEVLTELKKEVKKIFL